MNIRTKLWALVLALGVLGCVCGLVFYMAAQESEPETAEQEPPWVDLSAGRTEDITALSWAWQEQTVNLAVTDTGWVNVQDETCPLDADKLLSLLQAVSDLSAQVVEREVEELAVYGLDKPTLTVMAATADHIDTYLLGAEAADGGWYLCLENGQTVYWVANRFAQTFQIQLDSLVCQTFLPADIAQVTSLTVQTAGTAYTLFYDPEPEDTIYNYTWFHQTEEETTPVDETQAQTLCRSATDMAVSLVSWRGEETESYGFAQTQAVATVDYRTAQGQAAQVCLEFGDYDGDRVYVRLVDSPLVYAASASVLDGLLYPDWTAMTPLDVCPMGEEPITRAVVSLDGHTFDIVRYQETLEPTQEGEEPPVDVIYSASGWVLDTTQTQAWLDGLTTLQAQAVADQTQGREELLAAALYISGEEIPSVSLSFWSYDSAHCLCILEEETAFFIDRETVLSLVAQAEALLLPE